jgi:pimeloyl-ACP methyl ester carboxylesterase
MRHTTCERARRFEIANQLRATIPAAELAVLTGAGHVSNMEQPAAFNRVVRDFCLTEI